MQSFGNQMMLCQLGLSKTEFASTGIGWDLTHIDLFINFTFIDKFRIIFFIGLKIRVFFVK